MVNVGFPDESHDPKRAGARLAVLLATGISPEEASETLGIARETVRKHLISIFAKTDTHRQSALVALLNRF
jgi:DNA-binding CsgD family transcriptional regulator